jgi:hypothetical protein
MTGIRQPLATIGRIGVGCACVIAVTGVPVLAASLAAATLLLISVLALTGALSTEEDRRRAAYRILKLILDVMRPAPAPSRCRCPGRSPGR